MRIRILLRRRVSSPAAFKPERALTAEPLWPEAVVPGSQGKNTCSIHPVGSHLLYLTSEENSLRQSVRSQVQRILAQTVDDSAAAARQSIGKKVNEQ